MGNQQSSILHDCLTSIVDTGTIAFPSKPFFQLTDVRPYNLDIHVSPIAVTYPSTNEEVAGIVKCAAENSAKVQARSGGHSYGNFGMCFLYSESIIIE
jgi:FAD/FMN-containing dehydrogenase